MRTMTTDYYDRLMTFVTDIKSLNRYQDLPYFNDDGVCISDADPSEEGVGALWSDIEAALAKLENPARP